MTVQLHTRPTITATATFDPRPHIRGLPAKPTTSIRGVDLVAVQRTAEGTYNGTLLTKQENALAFRVMWANEVPSSVMAERLGMEKRQVERWKKTVLYGPPRVYYEHIGPRQWQRVTRVIKYGPGTGEPCPFPHVRTGSKAPRNVTIRRADGTRDVVSVYALRRSNPFPGTPAAAPENRR